MGNKRETSQSTKQMRAANDGIFKRRKKGIKKKAMELATLCDVAVCVMIQAPNGEYEMWPENPHEVRTIVSKLKEKSNKPKNSSTVQKSSCGPSIPGLSSAEVSLPTESFYDSDEIFTQGEVPNIEIDFPWNQAPDFCLPTESLYGNDEDFTQEGVPNAAIGFLRNQVPDFSLPTERFYGHDEFFSHGEVPNMEIGFQTNQVAEFAGENWFHENASEIIDFFFEGIEPADPGKNWFRTTGITNYGAVDGNQQYLRGEEPAVEDWWSQMLAIDDLEPPTFFHSKL